VAPDVRLSSRPPAEASCPYCRTSLEPGQLARTCVQCGAPYHEACTVELPRCGVLGCGGEFSRPEIWDPTGYTLSERIRRAIRKPHVTALHPGIEPEDDGAWVHELRRSKGGEDLGLPWPERVKQLLLWAIGAGIVGGFALTYYAMPALFETLSAMLSLVFIVTLLAVLLKSVEIP